MEDSTDSEVKTNSKERARALVLDFGQYELIFQTKGPS